MSHYDPGTPPRIIVTRHSRWWWSARIEHGLLVTRHVGRPHALTRRRAEAKGRRLLREYLAQREPEEYEVTP